MNVPLPPGMTLKVYVRGPLREANPDLPRHTQQRLIRIVDRFCDWLQSDVCLADVTTEQINAFATSDDNSWFSPSIARELKRVLKFARPDEA